ncbi:hypothetical protein [Shinella zoogloeoides]|uniref:Uncharacterized protein n=1 Tax=Shinella zoogloeoides TaxID=352475 RepID=A0A6N8TEI7_SHIZO|nr:hypothetical protein [Shinella zoogloeoides]MXN99539.1 hypothetical protein [Shinella zoogloeoides]UEX82684.1 hypothetical protein K8M09_05245 [Shinella zoogloeoides]
MCRKTRATFGAMMLALACQTAAFAQDTPTDADMRGVHAVLLGLAQDGAEPERDGSADVFYSIVETPEAPRLVTRLEVSGAPCRARTTTALQFPGKWATLTFALVDLSRVTAITAYASVDDMIAEVNPVPFDAPEAEQIVLTGKGLYCSSRLSLSGENTAADETCSDRLDLPMTDREQKARGQHALAIVAGVCKAPAFRRR